MRPVKVPVVLFLTCLATPVLAQRNHPMSYGIGVGAAPTVAGRNLPYEMGAHVTAFAEIPRALGRVSVRADVSFAGFIRNTLNGAVSRRTTVPGASLNVSLPLVDESNSVRPYLLAGAGTFRTDLGGGSAELHLGIAAGGGVQLGRGRVRPFAEVRMLRINDGATPRIVPVSVGLRF